MNISQIMSFIKNDHFENLASLVQLVFEIEGISLLEYLYKLSLQLRTKDCFGVGSVMR